MHTGKLVVLGAIAWLMGCGRAEPESAEGLRLAASMSGTGGSMVCDPPDKSGSSDMSGWIQNNCLIPGMSSDLLVQLVPGSYRIDSQLWITAPMILTTLGRYNTAGCYSDVSPDWSCAALRAGPGLFASGGTLQVSGRGVIVDHLLFDGSGGEPPGSPRYRVGTPAWQSCFWDDVSPGYGLRFVDCTDCQFSGNAVFSALCGSGLNLNADPGMIVSDNLISSNGVPNAQPHAMISDGITAYLQCSNTRCPEIVNNTIYDNTDIDLILFNGPSTVVVGNRIRHEFRAGSSAGIMLAGFIPDDANVSGHFEGAVVGWNTVDGGNWLLSVGIQDGDDQWRTGRRTYGGEITGNTIRGAKIGINLGGGGTPQLPTWIHDNAIQNSYPGMFSLAKCGNIHGTYFNAYDCDCPACSTPSLAQFLGNCG